MPAPLVSTRQYVDGALPEPRDMAPEQYRKARDDIRTRVAAMLAALGVPLPS